jgi:hypothetical protein
MRVERLDDGAWRFSKPDGEAPVAVLPERTRPIAEINRERGIHVTPETATTRLCDERMHVGIAINALLRRSGLRDGSNSRVKNVSAETPVDNPEFCG